jgi:hypothetical protein
LTGQARLASRAGQKRLAGSTGKTGWQDRQDCQGSHPGGPAAEREREQLPKGVVAAEAAATGAAGTGAAATVAAATGATARGAAAMGAAAAGQQPHQAAAKGAAAMGAAVVCGTVTVRGGTPTVYNLR